MKHIINAGTINISKKNQLYKQEARLQHLRVAEICLTEKSCNNLT